MHNNALKIEPEDERSDDSRRALTLLCEVRQGTRPWKLARLEDLSQTGFRVAWLPGATKSMPLRIRIPGLQMLNANIRWQKGNAIGCEFETPLYFAVFENLLAKAVIDGPLSR